MRHPLSVDALSSAPDAAGWTLERVVSMDDEYLRWYEALVGRIEVRREDIVAASSPGFFEFVLGLYTQTREDIACGRLGGATFYATARG